MQNSVLRDKSFDFAVQIFTLTKQIQSENREYIVSKQLLRSGTAIGAILAEAEFGQTKADFAHKISLSLKEANETKYWLRLLSKTKTIERKEFDHVYPRCLELIRMLVATLKTIRSK